MAAVIWQSQAMLHTVGAALQKAGHRYSREAGFPSWTISYQFRGRTRFDLAGTPLDKGGGSALFVRPHTPYRLEVLEDSDECWAIFDPPPSWEGLLTWPETVPGFAVVTPTGQHTAAATAAFREAMEWWRSGSPGRAALAMNALERYLLLLAQGRAGEPWADLHPGVRRALAYLAPGPADKTTITTLARRSGMSPSHLAHTFSAQIGESPLSWLEGRRIARAQQLLLTTDLPIKKVALTCGFADGEHLARRFRARIGQSPGEWRMRPGT